jgi:hypothetical protein
MRLVPQESYWHYKAPPTPDEAPPGEFTGNWFSLSPGMRREIWRDYERRTKPKAPDPEPMKSATEIRREYLDRKTEVQIAARERL